jgi:hypothetical protein
MATKPAARRPILVNWIYNDGDHGSNAFIERVLATPDEGERLRQRLLRLTDPSVDSRTRSGAIYDLYVGPEQSVPTSFEDFWRELDLNPYIAAHETRNRQSAA